MFIDDLGRTNALRALDLSDESLTDLRSTLHLKIQVRLLFQNYTKDVRIEFMSKLAKIAIYSDTIMTEPQLATGSEFEQQAQGLTSSSETFEKMRDLLKAKDDTSRFVGLALLKSVLDNEQQLVQKTERLQILWESISPKFLDRLLKAQLSGNPEKTQAKDMVDLAVAVLHTFSILLSENIRKKPQLTGRTGALVKSLVQR